MLGSFSAPTLPSAAASTLVSRSFTLPLTGAFDPDVLLFAHGGVELLHQLVEAFQLIAVVVGPDRDGGGQLASAAGSAAQRHGGAQQQTDGRTKDSFHYIISPIPTKTAHGKTARPVVSEMIPDENIVTLFSGRGLLIFEKTPESRRKRRNLWPALPFFVKSGYNTSIKYNKKEWESLWHRRRTRA